MVDGSSNMPPEISHLRTQSFPPNSRKSKEDAQSEKRATRIITDGVTQRKKPLGRQIAETFTGDGFQTVGHYVLFEIMIPAAKDMLFDVITGGAAHSLFGDNSGRRSNVVRRAGQAVTNQYWSSTKNQNDRVPLPARAIPAQSRYNFDDIVIDDRGKAEEVIDQLVLLIEEYEVARVQDLFELVGITGHYTDQAWGWTDLRTASVTRTKEGYLLNLPKPKPIE